MRQRSFSTFDAQRGEKERELWFWCLFPGFKVMDFIFIVISGGDDIIVIYDRGDAGTEN